ncbi:MAG: class I SAM-dependent methyltransferase [Planctomycetota bacterium]|jgi:hypothetical protein
MIRLLGSILERFGVGLVRRPLLYFHSHHYLRHNARRLEHLASLRIPVAGASVLEVGAGVGDHSHYYLDRGCRVTITEVREENLACLRRRYPGVAVRRLDMESPVPLEGSPFEIVHCYGLLYHLSDPEGALKFMAENCSRVLFLETRVAFGEGEELRAVAEDRADPTQACSGRGCAPTRAWLLARLRGLFEHVYVPRTQPNHEEFPLDWSSPEQRPGIGRAVFVASRQAIENDLLAADLPDRQTRHD